MNEAHSEHVRQLTNFLERQHRPLLGALRGLETMLEPSPPAQGDLERKLNALADILEAHVQEEESGDLYRWVPATFGETKEALDDLRGEHASLVETVRQLAVATRGAETVRPSTDLSIRIRTAIADIRQHEARESAVLRELG